MSSVTLFTRPMCGYCTVLRQELESRGVAFQTVDIWERRDQAEVVRNANGGDELVPTVKVGDRYFANPSVEEVLSAIAS